MIAKTRDRSAAKGALWRTTQNFLNLFGLASLADLYQGNKLERVFGPAYSARAQGPAAAPRNGTSGQHAPELS